jgi:hypothetical protein
MDTLPQDVRELEQMAPQLVGRRCVDNAVVPKSVGAIGQIAALEFTATYDEPQGEPKRRAVVHVVWARGGVPNGYAPERLELVP